MIEEHKITLLELKKIVNDMLTERDWHQFHNPRTDAMGMSIEASELMELFLFDKYLTGEAVLEQKREAVEDELADVLFWVLCFSVTANIDLAKAFQHKMKKNIKKYPVKKCKGKTTKYTEL